jgi:hypothetical protein
LLVSHLTLDERGEEPGLNTERAGVAQNLGVRAGVKHLVVILHPIFKSNFTRLDAFEILLFPTGFGIAGRKL